MIESIEAPEVVGGAAEALSAKSLLVIGGVALGAYLAYRWIFKK